MKRLNFLKASKMKELVLKKQDELEEIYRGVHMDIESDAERQILIDLIDSGFYSYSAKTIIILMLLTCVVTLPLYIHFFQIGM